MFWTLAKRFPFASKGQKMRTLWGARAAQVRNYEQSQSLRAARHFVFSPAYVAEPREDFYKYGYDPLYQTVYGGKATHRQRVVPGVLPKNVNKSVPSAFPSVHEYFDQPASLVSICQKRAIRRQVIFALGLNRKGSRPGKNHYWKQSSLVRCLWHGGQLIPPSVDTANY